MLICDSLSKSFGKHRVLSGISAEFPSQACSIIVGINGAGKTTLLNCIAGLSEASSGVVSIDGEAIVGTPEYKRRVFYIPSDFFLPDFMTGAEYANFVFSRYGTSRADLFHGLASSFGIEADCGRLINTYSFGMKKKLQLAIAACVQADYLLIDEGMTGLDFETTLLTQELIKRLSATAGIVLVTHDMDTVRCFPQHVFLLKEGNLVSYSESIDKLPDVVSKDESYEQRTKYLDQFSNSL